MKSALVCGAGGFIGSHLVRRLKQDCFWVRGVDLKEPEYSKSPADDFLLGDLRNPQVCHEAIDRRFDEVFQLAADMGGAGYVFTGEHDADIMRNSALINLNVLDGCRRRSIRRIFYSSSACVYPEHNQLDPTSPNCAEASAYPANPDSDYGWEKLFSERLYLSCHRNYGTEVRIARFHNVFGEEGTWLGGREKSPAAICRKVAEVEDGGAIDIWGDGQQTRSFLYIEDCIEGLLRLTRSNWTGPVNIGSEEMVTIDELARRVSRVAGKTILLRHIAGPQGVRGRRSDNQLIHEKLGWQPNQTLEYGLTKTYAWIEAQIRSARTKH